MVYIEYTLAYKCKKYIYIVCVMASNEMLCVFLICNTILILAVFVQLEIVEIALVKIETPWSVLPFAM